MRGLTEGFREKARSHSEATPAVAVAVAVADRLTELKVATRDGETWEAIDVDTGDDLSNPADPQALLAAIKKSASDWARG